MRKIITTVAVILCLCLCLSGCHANVAYTFTVSTGDKVRVQLDVIDGHSLKTEDSGFSVSKDGQKVLEGVFLDEDYYDDYLGQAKAYGTILESKGDMYFFTVEDTEGRQWHYYIFYVDHSDTGVLVGGTLGEDATREAFEHLTITLKDD